MPSARASAATRSAISGSRLRRTAGRPRLTTVTWQAAGEEGLGHLEADVAAADHDHPPDRLAAGGHGLEPGGVGRVCTTDTCGRSPCGPARDDRAGAGADHQLVEADAADATASRGPRLDRAGVEVDGRRLGVHPDLDVLAPNSSGVRATRIVDVVDLTTDDGRDPARGVAGAAALLDDDDLDVGPRAADTPEAAAIPPASPPITTSRSVMPGP